MYSTNRFHALQAARQITRQIVDAVRAPNSPSLTSGVGNTPDAAPSPDVTTGVDENGVTTYQALFDVDDFDGAATWAP
jgi:hypothetical protein